MLLLYRILFNNNIFLDLSNLFNLDSKKNSSNSKLEDLFVVPKISRNNAVFDSDLNIHLYWNSKDDKEIIWILNDIFIKALSLKASDIHFEPKEKVFQIRYRVDWSFIIWKEFSKDYQDLIIARIKIMSNLRIDEHRLPQDWKITYRLFANKSVDMRVSVIPTIYWEKIVIRLLKKDSKPPKLKELWIMPYNMVKIKKHLKDPYGMILAVWPTGSWKSTTLFSLLNQFDPKEKNISTLEDPVEYRIPWVNHTQINPAIDFNFAKGLRSLLRQDPDIIMVWEIRDEETAKLAVEASITGHIVFSTLHTNSATHTLQRLVNLGIDPLLISSSLKLVISQRLARKLCHNCKIKYHPDEKIKKYIVWKVWKYIKNKDNIILYKANEKWCKKCNFKWYSWRIWLYEVLEITDAMENLILQKASRHKLEIQAIWDWMIPIKQDWLLKVILWETSLEEILAVLWH